jgi:DNA invertase Pin-like site-specific DNA recombinase
MADKAALAAIYTRMSYALDHDQTKVRDQERIARSLAAARGIPVREESVYCDNNRSAWARNRKRPGWDAMLADVDAGRVGVIITYHGDRMIRQPRDLETLIELADSRRVRVISVSGDKDLDSAEDRYVLRIEAAAQCKSSDDTSRRRKAQYQRWALEGRVQAAVSGGRRMGFAPDGLRLWPACRCDAVTRAEVSEADVIREMARRVLAGESRRSVAASLAARGWTAPSGAPVTAERVRDWLANPRYAGLMPDGESKAAWPAILEREEWEALRVVGGRIAGANPRPTNARRWLLSGIAACGRCGAPLSTGASGEGYSAYTCPAHHLRRAAEPLDAYVSGYVTEALADPAGPPAALPASPAAAAEWRALEAEQADAEAQLADYRASARRSRLLNARLDGIERRMAQLREAAGTSARERLARQYQGITLEAFRGLPLDVRRALVRATVTVTVLPASRRGPGFRECDVRVERAG